MADELKHKDPGSELTQAEFTATDGHAFDSQAQGDILYASSTTVLSRLGKDANATRALTNTGTNNNPAWTQIALATGVSGTLPVGNGGTGATTLTDGGILLGSGTDAVTAMAVLADGEMIVGDGTTDPVAESGTTLRTSIGVGTTDSPQLTGIELGHATDSTITRGAAGLLEVEGVRLVTVSATQTLTNKTLTTPTIGSFANSAHDHADAAGGAAVVSASATVSGIAELATTAEINTGDDTGRVITPKALADSALGERVIQMVCVDFATALTTGSKFYFHVPSTLNGFDIVHAHAETMSDPSGSTIIIDLHNATQSDAVILSGKLTIGIGEHGSDESGGSHTVDTGQDDLQTNDIIRVDIDQIGSGDAGTGLIVTLICRLP